MVISLLATLLLFNEPSLPIPDLRNAFVFSKEPARPGAGDRPDGIRVFFTQSRQTILMPDAHRLDLRYTETLEPASSHSAFWIEIEPTGEDLLISVHLDKVVDQFHATYSAPPLQILSPESPFYTLAQAHWLGATVFPSGSHCLEFPEGHTFLKPLTPIEWRDGEWIIGDEAPAVARISGCRDGLLEWDGWDGDNYVHFALSPHADPTWKNRMNGLLNQVRIRSAKQISCSLEKQSLIIKVGDWVLKQNGSWKVLRKPAERTALLEGKLYGELFILDAIEENSRVMARCIHPSRTQLLPIETSPQKGRKKQKM